MLHRDVENDRPAKCSQEIVKQKVGEGQRRYRGLASTESSSKNVIARYED